MEESSRRMQEYRNQARQILSPSNEDRRRQVGFPPVLDPQWEHNLKWMGPPDPTTARMEESSCRMQEYRDCDQTRRIFTNQDGERRNRVGFPSGVLAPKVIWSGLEVI